MRKNITIFTTLFLFLPVAILYVPIKNVAKAQNTTKVGLSMRVDSFFVYGTMRDPTCVLENNTDTTFTATTYSKLYYNNKMLYRIIFGEQVEKNGKWINGGGGWCGNGLSQDTLRPGEKWFVDFGDYDEYWKKETEAIIVSISLRAINPSSEKFRVLSREINLK